MAARKKAAAPSANADDLLNDLMEETKAPPKAPVTKKKERPIIRAQGEEAAILDRFTSSDAIMKVAKGSLDAVKAQAMEVFKRRFFKLCVERGYRPENPEIVSDNGKCILQMKHMSLVRRVGIEQIKQVLVELGLSAEDILQTVREKKWLGMRNFTDLMAEDAKPEEKAVAKKILEFVKTQLTPAERELVLTKGADVVVEDGWQETAINLAVTKAKEGKEGGELDVDRGVEVLDRLFRTVEPQFAFGSVAFSGELSEALKELRGHEDDGKAVAVPKVITDKSGHYKAVIEGNKMSLFLVRPGAEDKPMGVKECEDSRHAENSVRKLFNNEAELTKFIAESK